MPSKLQLLLQNIVAMRVNAAILQQCSSCSVCSNIAKYNIAAVSAAILQYCCSVCSNIVSAAILQYCCSVCSNIAILLQCLQQYCSSAPPAVSAFQLVNFYKLKQASLKQMVKYNLLDCEGKHSVALLLYNE